MAAAKNYKSEAFAAEAFSRQSEFFDEIYSPNPVIRYKRERVRAVVEKFLQPYSKILELNAGTGEDAIYFAQKNHHVHASDISGKMLEKLTKKVAENGLENNISTEECSYTKLQNIQNKGPYDLIFSNFAGLNCTGELAAVLESFNALLKPGGLVILVVMPPFSLWELMFVLRGNFRAALRRLGSKNGVKAHIEGTYFGCWYYKPSFIINTLADSFTLAGLEGLSTITPPSAFENFPRKHPEIFALLAKWEDKLKSKWPWKFIGDYYIISLRKK